MKALPRAKKTRIDESSQHSNAKVYILNALLYVANTQGEKVTLMQTLIVQAILGITLL